MPLVTANAIYEYGIPMYMPNPPAYCQANTSAPDYGRCYNIMKGRAIYVQTDTATYPTLPCERDNTCIRYTTAPNNIVVSQIFSYPNKQAILQYFWSRTHANRVWYANITFIEHVAIPMPDSIVNTITAWFLPAPHYEAVSWPIYDPVTNFKAYYNPYTIASGHVAIIRWYGNMFCDNARLIIRNAFRNNLWYIFDVTVAWAYESSPLAIIPLDYDREYVPYQELRNAFGYAVTGVDQPGWNAEDIIRVLRELFPDRAWAVFDDRQRILYLYNITPDFVPDWLVERLTPVAMKVLRRPSDSSVAKMWLDELNRRNVYSQPPSVEA